MFCARPVLADRGWWEYHESCRAATARPRRDHDPRAERPPAHPGHPDTRQTRSRRARRRSNADRLPELRPSHARRPGQPPRHLRQLRLQGRLLLLAAAGRASAGSGPAPPACRRGGTGRGRPPAPPPAGRRDRRFSGPGRSGSAPGGRPAPVPASRRRRTLPRPRVRTGVAPARRRWLYSFAGSAVPGPWSLVLEGMSA
jgi:hypothetical protein